MSHDEVAAVLRGQMRFEEAGEPCERPRDHLELEEDVDQPPDIVH
ncbi:hypothetical protein [Desulfovibrio sp.]|nr:hypothetical protein [Desulfovibrio sp.]